MRVYADALATTKPLPEVVDAMLPYLSEEYGNPSSIYELGERAKTAVDDARARVASLINAPGDSIVFTSSGAEANNLAVKGIATALQAKGRHLIASSIEHFSILHPLKTLERHGFETTLVPVDETGRVSPAALASSIRPDTVLISIQHASGEIGTVQDIASLGEITHDAGIAFHVDAVQSAGLLPIDVDAFRCDALTLSAHQFYGPKGVGAVYLRPRTRLIPQIEGGIQERGRRAGTENVPGIVGMGVAADIARRDRTSRATSLASLRDRLIDGVLTLDHVRLTGHPTERLPHHASFAIEFVEGESMLLFLAMDGIAASSGSACTSKALKASHVLLSIGLSHEVAHGSLVFTLTIDNTTDDIDYILEKLPSIVERLRQLSPLVAKKGSV